MFEQRETSAADTEKISIKVTAELNAVGTATDQRMQRFSLIPCPLAIDLQSEAVNDHKVSCLKAIWNLWVGIALITCLRQVEMTLSRPFLRPIAAVHESASGP
jgi:hypothetical protein